MKPGIFVDGQAGTTGLKILDRLKKRDDLEILNIAADRRKDPDAKTALFNQADIVFLCLPDSASRESVALAENTGARIIDTSTAFRTDPKWTYGLPELSPEHRRAISTSNRVANPGCHATGFNTAVFPLIKNQILPPDYPLTCQSLSGYSGAGKQMISSYEEGDYEVMRVPRHYALGLTHKHLPEMQKISGLDFPPLFSPIIANFYHGMAVTVPLHSRSLSGKMNAQAIQNFLADYYQDADFIRVMPYNAESNLVNGFMDAAGCNNSNRLDLFVFGHEEQVLLLARLDNLGKGASGAAIQNMNIMLGLEEKTGLETGL